MTSTAASRCLLIVALLHLGGDMAVPGDSVLCIRADGHRAIEAEYGAARCKSGSVTETSAAELRIAPLSECADQSLHAASEELVSKRVDGNGTARTHATTNAARLAPSPGSCAPRATAAINTGRLDPRIRAQRTVVLLV